jgi:hypothetical protein
VTAGDPTFEARLHRASLGMWALAGALAVATVIVWRRHG